MPTNEHHYCMCLTRENLSDEDLRRLAGHKAALLTGAKWDVGSVITIRFLEGAPGLQGRVEKVAKEWTGSAMANLSLDFRKTGPTDIRIAFQQGDGSWSYLGTMCRQIPEAQPTMNYGWLTSLSDDDELRRVVLHEFGHALGLIHEHQNPERGITWNEAAVVRDLSGPPNNWDLATIKHNMFKKYERSEVTATDLDPHSIMMYPIPKAWTLDGFSADLNSTHSMQDRALIKSAYPH
jgi:serralysin